MADQITISCYLLSIFPSSTFKASSKISLDAIFNFFVCSSSWKELFLGDFQDMGSAKLLEAPGKRRISHDGHMKKQIDPLHTPSKVISIFKPGLANATAVLFLPEK